MQQWRKQTTEDGKNIRRTKRDETERGKKEACARGKWDKKQKTRAKGTESGEEEEEEEKTVTSLPDHHEPRIAKF